MVAKHLTYFFRHLENEQLVKVVFDLNIFLVKSYDILTFTKFVYKKFGCLPMIPSSFPFLRVYPACYGWIEHFLSVWVLMYRHKFPLLHFLRSDWQ